MPAATMKSVPSSTRNRLRTDHSMMRPSISVRPAAAGSRLCAHDQIVAAARVDEFEVDLLARLQGADQGRILDAEIHRHRRPLEARDRAMGERLCGETTTPRLYT